MCLSPLRCLALISIASAVATLAACGGGAPAPQPAPAKAPAAAASAPAAPVDPAVTAAAEAEQIFTTRCSVCHGPAGKGDGPGAAALNPKPQNYTDPAFQARVTDEEIEKAILLGGAAVGKSPLMPPNPDLSSKPAVVTALRMKVRSFGAAPAATAPAP